MKQYILVCLLITLLLGIVSSHVESNHKKHHDKKDHGGKVDPLCPSIHMPGTCEAICSPQSPCSRKNEICCPTACGGTYCWDHTQPSSGHSDTDVKVSQSFHLN